MRSCRGGHEHGGRANRTDPAIGGLLGVLDETRRPSACSSSTEPLLSGRRQCRSAPLASAYSGFSGAILRLFLTCGNQAVLRLRRQPFSCSACPCGFGPNRGRSPTRSDGCHNSEPPSGSRAASPHRLRVSNLVRRWRLKLKFLPVLSRLSVRAQAAAVYPRGDVAAERGRHYEGLSLSRDARAGPVQQFRPYLGRS